jgi:hypothetical protein
MTQTPFHLTTFCLINLLLDNYSLTMYCLQGGVSHDGSFPMCYPALLLGLIQCSKVTDTNAFRSQTGIINRQSQLTKDCDKMKSL